MTHRSACLLDHHGAAVATLAVQFRDGHYEGTIGLNKISPPLLQLFEEFEAIVEGQIFSLLDEVQEKLDSLPLRVAFEDGSDADVLDLQVFPSRRQVSFATLPSQDRDGEAVSIAPGNDVKRLHSEGDLLPLT